MYDQPKLIREIDDLRLVRCRAHRKCVIRCHACKVVIEPKFYELPPLKSKDRQYK